MFIRDESLTKVMEAAEAEALRLNASAAGSEHILLGLVSARDAVTEEVLVDHPELTLEAVRRAVVEAVDDAPHLQRLGVDLDALRQAEEALPADRRVNLRNRHTAEFQRSLDDSSLKYSTLVKQNQLPRRARVSATSLCWLQVLEPGSRTHRLLQSLGVDPDRLRARVLAAMVEPGSPTPDWPAHVRRGVLDRLYERFAERAFVSS